VSPAAARTRRTPAGGSAPKAARRARRAAKPKRALVTGAAAEVRVTRFIARFEPKTQKLIRDCRARLRRRLPGANELVWDNYNFFVIGYSPTERPYDSWLSLAAAANGVGLSFLRGASLPDPHGLLEGAGKQNRFVRLAAAGVLARPEVDALVAAAIAQGLPLPARKKGQLILRSISAKQRPRRRAAS